MTPNQAEIQLDDSGSNFHIAGDIESLLKSARVRHQIRSLEAKKTQKNLLEIPYSSENKEKIFKHIHDVLNIANISPGYTHRMLDTQVGFLREKRTFDLFSMRAREIRNNTFRDNEELRLEFEDFLERTREFLPGRVLYELQLLAAYHLAFSQNACNFSVPGSGKTTIVYAAYAYLKSLIDPDKRVEKIVIIGPTAAFGPWEDEYKDCFNASPRIARISDSAHTERKNYFYSENPSEVTVINYQLLDRYCDDIGYFLKKHPAMLVVDEAHYIKSIDGVWSSALLRFSSQAVSRVALSGTPAPNGLEDIFNLYRFILPYNYERVLGMNHASLRALTKNQLESARIEEFSEQISPFFIRIKKEDLKNQLPRVIEHEPIKVAMSASQRDIYDYIEQKYVNSFLDGVTDSFKHKLAQAKIIRLRQAATNPGLLLKPLEEYYGTRGYSGDLGIDDVDIVREIENYPICEALPMKFVALRELVERILAQKENQKVLIWSQFTQNSKIIQQMMQSQNMNTELLIGEVDRESRRKIIRLFNDPNDTSFRIVVANPRAVGESISLHMGCNTAIYFDMDYNAASYIQTRDRIHRVMRPLPEKAETHYYSIMAEDSIDEVIAERVNKKVEVMEKLINQDIPLFLSSGAEDDNGSEDLIRALINDYIKRHNS